LFILTSLDAQRLSPQAAANFGKVTPDGPAKYRAREKMLGRERVRGGDASSPDGHNGHGRIFSAAGVQTRQWALSF
jgi:hypothetical protein